MSPCATSKCSSLSRRHVLVFGISTLGLGTSCALLRGGAKHPVYEPSAALREGSLMRIPMAELRSLGAPAVLEVRPGKGEPDLLVTQEADGTWRVVTADCPHAGCTVDWDGAGGKWACPCHGSAFAPDGKLLNGPAKEGLKSFSAKAEKDSNGVESLAIDLSMPT